MVISPEFLYDAGPLADQALHTSVYFAHRNTRPAFAIFTETLCEGLIPAWHDDRGLPVTYATELEAQIEIAEMLIEHLKQFIVGERDFADALTTDDFILPVEVHPDGTIQLEDGRCFGAQEL